MNNDPNHKYNHKIRFEFKEGRFPNGWRGDRWCTQCSYSIYSSEAARMRYFGLATVGVQDMGSGEEIYIVNNLKVL